MKAVSFTQKAQKHAEKVVLFCVFQRLLREKIGNNAKRYNQQNFHSELNLLFKTSKPHILHPPLQKMPKHSLHQLKITLKTSFGINS